MQKTELRAGIDRTTPKIYAIMHRILDGIERRQAPASASAEPRTPALAAAFDAPWRWANDRFGFWKLCTNRRCRRARRCCGEPRQCLDCYLPAVPQQARDRVRAELRAARTRVCASAVAPE